MTAEEFFRNKIKEKNPIIEVVTLSTYLVTAEEAMLWAYEFNQLEKSEKPIISDEEIVQGAYWIDDQDKRQAWECGAKWYREQLKSK